MRITLLTGVLVLCLFCWSCSKSSDQISYQSVYHKTAITSPSAYTLYSNQGQITDPAILSRFYALDSPLLTFYSQAYIQSAYLLDSIMFTDPLHAKLFHNSEWINCDVGEQLPKFILTRISTSSYTTFPDQYSQSVPYLICLYKPEVDNEWLISSTGGINTFGYTTREKYLYKLSGDQLCAQLLFFTEHHPYLQTGSVVNFQDQSFYQSIAEGDTVSVQSFSLQYAK